MKQCTFYSGAAYGADSIWAAKLRKLGHIVKDYTTDDYDKLTPEWKAIISRQYEEVCRVIHRNIIPDTTAGGKLVRRDMMQADKATEILAIGEIENGMVKGGTAYAFNRGILRGIPVYIYDQQLNRWYTHVNGSLTECVIPNLIDGAAVIGTRHLNAFGINAISDVVNRGVF